jgi:hypothetical protein
MKKPSAPKCLGGSQKMFLGCSTSSLAVFYVEQVALNRHVRRHFRLPPLCAIAGRMSRATSRASRLFTDANDLSPLTQKLKRRAPANATSVTQNVSVFTEFYVFNSSSLT